MSAGLVSVIIPVYNRGKMIADAVESVIVQSYRNFEIIIVDDGSSDCTPTVVETLRKKYRDIVIRIATHSVPQGPGAARQTGLGTAKGQFIQYLDSDDLLERDKFLMQISALQENPKSDVAYGWTRYQKKDGAFQPHPWKGSGEKREAMFPSFLNDRWWDTPNPLYRASRCREVGSWLKLFQEEDWEYDCRIAANNAPLSYVPHYVCTVRDHSEQRLSSDVLDIVQRLKDQTIARTHILNHAKSSGMNYGCPEMVRFSRQLFHLARQCSEVGLFDNAKDLVNLAIQVSGGGIKNTVDIYLYRALSVILGQKNMARLSQILMG